MELKLPGPGFAAEVRAELPRHKVIEAAGVRVE